MAKFTISDLSFRIRSARLEPFFEDPPEEPVSEHRLVWGVVIEAESDEDVANWKPTFTAERLFETEPREIEGWKDLDGRQGAWSDDDEMALLSTFEHEPLYDAEWSLAVAPSGRLLFKFKGRADFNHPGGYTGRLPIEIETELDFTPIPSGTADEDECRKQLAQFGITDAFEFRVIDGVSSLIPVHYPAA